MRHVIVVALLGVLVALAGPVAGQTNTDPKVADALVVKEKALLETLFKNNAAAFNAALTDDSTYVGEDGFVPAKADTSKPFEVGWAEYKPSDFKVVQPDANTALVMFKNWVKFKSGESTDSYQTTLWVKRNGEWRNMYHADIHPYSAKKDASTH